MIDISGHLMNFKSEKEYEDNENYVRVNSCGFQKFITKNLTRIREEGRIDYQIIYIVKGRGHFFFDGEMREVTEGNVVMYKPRNYQKFTYAFSDNPEAYWIHFTGHKAGQILDNSGLHSSGFFYIGLNNQFTEILKKMIHELQIKKLCFDQVVNASFLELMALIARAIYTTESSRKRRGDTNIDRVLELMHSSYNLKWSVNDFARQCNISPYRFIHKFKEYMGMSPLEYLTKVRIEKAKELLVSSSLNISEISEVIGYENPLYFSRVFRKMVKMSPSEYRNTNFE